MTIVVTAATAAEPQTKFPISRELASTPEEHADAQSWDRFVAAGVKSADLRLRIAFSIDGLQERNGGYFWHEAIPLETLVEQARGSTDPLVLAMLFGRCSADEPAKAPPRCDALDFARRWTVADTQNQLAWVTLAGELQRRGDFDAARTTFIRAAQASLWHEHYDDVARVIARALPQALTPRERYGGLILALGTSAARTVSLVPFRYLRTACKEPATGAACGSILETAFRDGETLFVLASSARLAEAAGLSDEAVRARTQRSDAMYWALTQFPFPERAELDDPSVAARAVDQAEHRLALGELGWGRFLLQQSGVTEADAAARYAASRAIRQSR